MRGRDSTIAFHAICACALVVAGCCQKPTPVSAVDFLPVRQAQLRSPACSGAAGCPPEKQIYPLPLDAVGRGALLMFFAAGGNNDNIEDGTLTTIVDPAAEGHYGPLLDELGKPASIDADDLSNGTYARWFAAKPLRQVIDARADRPPLACPPYAVRTERYEWIFTCSPGGKLGGVMVQSAPGVRLEK